MLMNNLQVISRYMNSENTIRIYRKRTLHINTQIIRSVKFASKNCELANIHIVVKNSKVCPVQFMKAYRGRRGTVPLILNLSNGRRWLVSFTPRPIYPRERRRHQMKTGCVGPTAGHHPMENRTIACPHSWPSRHTYYATLRSLTIKINF